MKLVPLLVFLTLMSLATAPLAAQQLDHPAEVPIRYYLFGNVGVGGSGTFSVGSDPTVSSDFVFPVSSGSGTGPGSNAHSDVTTAYVVPGREYSLAVTSSGMNVVAIIFPKIEGCEVYVNDTLATAYSSQTNNTNYPLRVRVERINDITQSLAGSRGGQCSSLVEDKPIWYIGLGSLRNGKYAGAVGFRRSSITADLFTTKALVYDSVDPSEVFVARSSGAISRIDSRDVVLMMDPYNASSTSYQIKAYMPIDMSTPYITYTVRQYAQGGLNGLRVDKVEDGITWSTALFQSGSNWTFYDWQQVAGASSQLATGNAVTTTVSGSTSTTNYGSGSGMAVKQKTFTTVNGRTELASVTWGPGVTSAPSTSYTYYAASTGGGWAQAVSTEVDTSGRWTKYEYFNAPIDASGANDPRAGQIQRIYRPWEDSPTTPGSATTANCLLETYDYDTSGPVVLPSLRETRINNTLMGRTTWSYNWGNGNINSYDTVAVERRDYSSSTGYLTTRTVSYQDAPGVAAYFRNHPHSVTRPDGTKDAYAYFNGQWNPATNVFTPTASGGARQVLIFHGQDSAGTGTTALSSWSGWVLDTVYLVANLSTVTQRITDAHGRLVYTSELVYAGGTTLEPVAAQVNTYDQLDSGATTNLHNLLTKQKDPLRSVSGGEVAVTYTYSAGLPASKTDVDGTRTEWTYDTYLRNDTIKTAASGSGSYPAKTQSFTYYSSNRKNTARECDCSPTVTSYTYETTGRLASISEPKPGGGTLTTTYSYPSPRDTTLTLPTGATKTTTLFYDGRVKSETGSGQVNTATDYSLSGGLFVRKTQQGATDANGWIEEKTDWLGRVVSQRVPQVGWTTGSTKVMQRNLTYDSTKGQLVSVSVVDEGTSGTPRLVPDHFYVYGSLGLLMKEGDDVDASGSLVDASNDRITIYTPTFMKEATGFTGWLRRDLAEVLDTVGNGTSKTIVVDRRTRLTRFNGGALLGGNARVLEDVSDYDVNGRETKTLLSSNLSARTRTQTLTSGGVSQSATTVWQDGYLKSEQSTSGRTVTYTYNSVGLLAKISEGTTNAAVSYNYHSGTKYLSSVVQTTGSSSNATTSYAYSWNTSAQSMTVAATLAGNTAYTEYNALGQPWRVWGDAVQPSLAGYDAFGRRTGLTTWRSGSFTATTWPTSPGAGDATTWTLDPATGAVMSKVYPNSSAVAFSYNPRGQLRTRTWARTPVVTTTYSYYDYGQSSFTGELKMVDYSDGTPDLSYTYTRFGAPATVTDAAGTRTFNYRADLQPNSEGFDASFYGSKTFTPSYDAQGRPSGFSYNSSTTASSTIGWDATTGRPNSVSGTLGGTTATFTLGYAAGTDWVNSVKSGSYDRSTPLRSASSNKHDAIASATTKWGSTVLGDFSAAYDTSRGWRNGQGVNAASYTAVLGLGGAGSTTYGYDSYGRLTGNTSAYAGRSLTWSYDLAGNRLTETDSATTNYTPDALNRYTAITGQRAEPGVTYDGDGNLTQDGTWTYSYDGENRLKSLSKAGQTITMTYDYLGRRIRKTVTGTGAYDVKFLWNGWQLAAELASSGTAVNKLFVWGRDFSDAQGAAGGAGALLAQISGTSVSYAIPDAQGSIVAYADGSGAIVAAVEYSPYGKGINAYGSWQSYPIGYSGQYMDWEPGLVYYGLRYYAPKHGRFINRDPIEEAGGSNLYGFVSNAPTRGWDVRGLGCTFECNSHGCTLTCSRMLAGEDYVVPSLGIGRGHRITMPGEGGGGGGGIRGGGGSGSDDPVVLDPMDVTATRDRSGFQNGIFAPKKTPCAELRKALRDAKLSRAAYGDAAPPGAFRAVGDPFTDPSGFRAALFENANTGERVLAYAGTNDWADARTDAVNAIGLRTQQVQLAVATANYVVGTYGSVNLSFTGHSLGGLLGATASMAIGLPSRTFNAAGPVVSDSYRASSAALVTNYYVGGEIVTASQSAVGFNRALGSQVEVAPADGLLKYVPGLLGYALRSRDRHLINSEIDALQQKILNECY